MADNGGSLSRKKKRGKGLGPGQRGEKSKQKTRQNDAGPIPRTLERERTSADPLGVGRKRGQGKVCEGREPVKDRHSRNRRKERFASQASCQSEEKTLPYQNTARRFSQTSKNASTQLRRIKEAGTGSHGKKHHSQIGGGRTASFRKERKTATPDVKTKNEEIRERGQTPLYYRHSGIPRAQIGRKEKKAQTNQEETPKIQDRAARGRTPRQEKGRGLGTQCVGESKEKGKQRKKKLSGKRNNNRLTYWGRKRIGGGLQAR